MSDSLPTPTNALVSIVNEIIDQLVTGVGKDIVIAQLQSSQPWLNIPIISWIFKWFVSRLAQSLDVSIKANVDIILIRFQNDARKQAYDEAINKLKEDTFHAVGKEGHEKALKDARDAMDKLINRNK